MHSSTRLLAFTVVFLLSYCASAQMTLEHTYPTQNFYMQGAPANLTNFGKKLMTSDTSSNIINLYNTDHSLFKSITAPTLSGYKLQSIFAVSDNLFNTDNLVEMIVGYYNVSLSPRYRTLLINEQGTTIQDMDSVVQASVYKDDNDNYKLKVFTVITGGTTQYTYRIYALPGSLPCDNCNALKTGSIQKSAPFISGPIPNPSDGNAVISYQLPQGDYEGMLTFYDINGRIIATYPVGNMQSSFQLNSKLAPGTYIYNLQTSSGLSECQKLTVR